MSSKAALNTDAVKRVVGPPSKRANGSQAPQSNRAVPPLISERKKVAAKGKSPRAASPRGGKAGVEKVAIKSSGAGASAAAQPPPSSRKLKKQNTVKGDIKSAVEEEPQAMVTTRTVVVRSGHEVSSKKLTDLAAGTPVTVIEVRDGDGGVKRAQVRYDLDGSSMLGWISSVLKDGTANLTAAAVAQQKTTPADATVQAPNVAAQKTDATDEPGAAKPANKGGVSSSPRASPAPIANGTPRAAPASTPRAAQAGTPRAAPASTPRAAPTGTPRAAPGGTPRAAPSGTPRAAPASMPRTAPSGTPRATPAATPRGRPGSPPPGSSADNEAALLDAAGEAILLPAAPRSVPLGFLAQPEERRVQKGEAMEFLPSATPSLPGSQQPAPSAEWSINVSAETLENALTLAEGKRPTRDDDAPSRHSIPTSWSDAKDPVLLFNCNNARCALIAGDASSFGDAQDGQLKACHPDQEPLGRVLVAPSKGADFMSRLEFKNKWLVGNDHGLRHDGLDRNATVDVYIDWRRDDGSKGSVRLRLWPWTSYACAPGSRLKITMTGHEADGTCCTVQRVLPEDDRCVVKIDYLDKESLIDARPDTAIRTTTPAYLKGDHLIVLFKAECRDAVVLEWLAETETEKGGCHRIRYHPLDASESHDGAEDTEDEIRDLNEFNHAVQRFASAEIFERVRGQYCEMIVSQEDKVEDAITGNELRIEDQLIYVATQNIGDLIKKSDTAWSSIKDVKELVELLLQPSIQRARGVHLAQPTLVRAGPGTGKTWMVKQAAYTLAKRLRTDDYKGMRPVPILVYVQRIVRLVREQGDEAEIVGMLLRTRSMLPWYIENNFDGPAKQMLLQAYEMRCLIVLIDGIDEAAGMKEAIEEFVHREVAVSGNRLVVTSRPEGVRLELYVDRFIVINLLPLSDEQQRVVINSQMQGNVFFDHLMSLSVIRKGQDDLYDEQFQPESRTRGRIENLKAPDLFYLPDGTGSLDATRRQHNVTGEHVVQELAADAKPTSTTLRRLNGLFTMKRLSIQSKAATKVQALQRGRAVRKQQRLGVRTPFDARNVVSATKEGAAEANVQESAAPPEPTSPPEEAISLPNTELEAAYLQHLTNQEGEGVSSATLPQAKVPESTDDAAGYSARSAATASEAGGKTPDNPVYILSLLDGACKLYLRCAIGDAPAYTNKKANDAHESPSSEVLATAAALVSPPAAGVVPEETPAAATPEAAKEVGSTPEAINEAAPSTPAAASTSAPSPEQPSSQQTAESSATKSESASPTTKQSIAMPDLGEAAKRAKAATRMQALQRGKSSRFKLGQNGKMTIDGPPPVFNTFLEALDHALAKIPANSDMAQVREAVDGINLDEIVPEDANTEEVRVLATKLGVFTLKLKAEEEGRIREQRRASLAATVKARSAASAAGGSTPRAAGSTLRAASGSTPRAASGSTPRAGGATPRKGVDSSETESGKATAAPPQRRASLNARGNKGGNAAAEGSDAPGTPRNARGPRNSVAISVPKHFTPSSTWAKITARTDEVYEVAETMHPVFERLLQTLLHEQGLPAELLEMGALKDPIRVHEKALEEYLDRFPLDDSGLPEACVCDVVRARIMCKDAEQLLQVAIQILKGFSSDTASIRLIQLQNHFGKLNPTHFRHLVCHVQVEHNGLSTCAELQLHHSTIFAFDEENFSHKHYSFFRNRLGRSEGENVNATLERVLLFLMEAAGVPVLLSLLVLVFSTTSGEEDLDRLPHSAFELYTMATQSAVFQRLQAIGQQSGGFGADGATRTRPAKMKLKGGADWRQGQVVADEQTMFDQGFTEEDVYEVYSRTHKVMNLLSQFGLSELKQKYVRDPRLKPSINKLLEIGLKKLPADEYQESGINMLRLVAVENQKNGRREFSSMHVANALAAGGDTELALWLRLDCEEAGVTLTKTLESLTDSAPAMYQFKHLSFQEGLFARNLLNLVDRKQWQGWDDDKAAAAFLNDAYMNNVCRIAAGELGWRLAKARPEWCFNEHRLSWVGKSALWQLVNENPSLESLLLNRNEVGPGMEGGGEALTDGVGLARLFSTCPRLQRVQLGFNQLGKFERKQTSQWTRALAGNASLTDLDLQSNNLGADGVKSVAIALTSCFVLQTVNLSRNQPGRNPEHLMQMLKEHQSLTNISLIEDDDKHLTSKAKSMLGEAILANPAHKLAYVSCDAFELGPTVKTLKLEKGKLSADIQLLAGALRSNSTLTYLELGQSDMGDSERSELGKALLDNELGVLGYCDEFGISPGCSDIEIDMKETAAARRGPQLLMGVLRANRSLKKLTIKTLGTEHIPLLVQAMRGNTTLEELQLEAQLKNARNAAFTLPVQSVTGAEAAEELDLSGAGELSRVTCAALGALLEKNGTLTSLNLSQTKLGDDAGSILEHLGNLCKTDGKLRALNLSEIGMTDRGARKLFDAMLSGEYPTLHSLVLAKNGIKDAKANGLVDMLRMEDCSLKELDVSDNALSGTLLMRALQMNRSLIYLNVRGTELDDAGVRFFGSMLLSPDCPCPIKLLSCDYFEVVEGTSALSFAGQTLSSAAMTLLFGILKLNSSVVSLDLANAGVDSEAALALEKALAANKTLQQLDLRGNDKLWMLEEGEDSSKIDSKGLEAIASGLHANNTVQSVYVDSMKLDVLKLKGAEAASFIDLSAKAALSGVSTTLAALLIQKNPTIAKLDLSSNKQVERLGQAIGVCLMANVSLTELTVRDAALGDADIAALVEGLWRNEGCRLSTLDLGSNSIGSTGAEHLAKMLGSNKSIRTLDLSTNTVGSDGAGSLSDALLGNASLTALSLFENSVEQAGVERIATVFKHNRTLCNLWLGKNKVTNEGIGTLVDALLAAKATRLSSLDLSFTGMGAAGIKHVVRLLTHGASLVALSLAGTKLEFTDTDALQMAAKENPELGRSKGVRLWMGKDNKNWPPLAGL